MGGTHLQFQCKQINVGDSTETNLIRLVNNQCHRRRINRWKEICGVVCFVRSPVHRLIEFSAVTFSLLHFGLSTVIGKSSINLDCDCIAIHKYVVIQIDIVCSFHDGLLFSCSLTLLMATSVQRTNGAH